MKKYIIALAIIVIITAVALMIWLRPSLVEEFKPTSTPVAEEANHPEEITLIENELASFDLGDLDAEFQTVDQEINNL